MPVRTQVVHSRIDPKLKKSAEIVFQRLGLSTTEAIRLFFKQVELYNGLPFELRIPNQETIAAIEEADHSRHLKRRTLAQFKKSLR